MEEKHMPEPKPEDPVFEAPDPIAGDRSTGSKAKGNGSPDNPIEKTRIVSETPDTGPNPRGSGLESDTVRMTPSSVKSASSLSIDRPADNPLHTLPESLQERYRFVRVLGKGGFANVYLAHDNLLDQDVAIKILKIDLASKSDHDRFLFEARISARLRHPNIVTVFDIIQTSGGLQLVMEFYPGGTLYEHLKEKGKMHPRNALQVSRQIGMGRAYAHERDIIHRDIKPANIFFGDDGLVKIGDFGIAANTHNHEHTQTGMIIGTPMYMAPEQSEDSRDVDPRTDLYALGLMLYHMLTGKTPRVIDMDQIPPEFKNIIKYSTEPERSERMVSAKQFIAMLDSVEKEISHAGIPGLSVTPMLQDNREGSPDVFRPDTGGKTALNSSTDSPDTTGADSGSVARDFPESTGTELATSAGWRSPRGIFVIIGLIVILLPLAALLGNFHESNGDVPPTTGQQTLIPSMKTGEGPAVNRQTDTSLSPAQSPVNQDGKPVVLPSLEPSETGKSSATPVIRGRTGKPGNNPVSIPPKNTARPDKQEQLNPHHKLGIQFKNLLSSDRHMNRGYVLLKKNEGRDISDPTVKLPLKTAVGQFVDSLKQSPEEPVVHFLLAYTRGRFNHNKAAEDDFRKGMDYFKKQNPGESLRPNEIYQALDLESPKGPWLQPRRKGINPNRR